VTPPPACDPATAPFSIAITNAGGTVFSDSLAAGALVKRGRTWYYRDPSARQSGGFFLVKITDRPDDPVGFRIDVKGFGDMSSATDPVMSIDATVCGVTSTITKTWSPMGTAAAGWSVNLDPVDNCPSSANSAFVP